VYGTGSPGGGAQDGGPCTVSRQGGRGSGSYTGRALGPWRHGRARAGEPSSPGSG